MTPLNTIIEEEINKLRTELKMYEVPYLETFLTSAMQRAYKAGQKINKEMLHQEYLLAINNGYALAIKHFEERVKVGEDVFESIESMKNTHRKSLATKK